MKEFAQKKTGLLAALAMALLLAVSVFVLSGCQQNNQNTGSTGDAEETTSISVPAISLLTAEQAHPIITSGLGETDDPSALAAELYKANPSMADDAKANLEAINATDIAIDDEGVVTATVPSEDWDTFVMNQKQQALDGIAMGFTITSATNWFGLSENSGVNQLGVEPDAEMTEIVLTTTLDEFTALGDHAGAIIFWQANQWVQNYAFLSPDYKQPVDERITILDGDVEENQELFSATYTEMVAADKIAGDTATQADDATDAKGTADDEPTSDEEEM